MSGLFTGAGEINLTPLVTDQADFDGDSSGEACDLDYDADGVRDASDSCLGTPIGAINVS